MSEETQRKSHLSCQMLFSFKKRKMVIFIFSTAEDDYHFAKLMACGPILGCCIYIYIYIHQWPRISRLIYTGMVGLS